jgi:hypothetical protein
MSVSFDNNTFSTEDIVALNRVGTKYGYHATFAINGGDNTKLDFGAGTARRFNPSTRKYEEVSWDAIAGVQQDATSLAASGPWYYLKWPFSHDGSKLDSSDVVYEIGEESYYHNIDASNHYLRLGRPRNVSNVGDAGFSIPLFFGYDEHQLVLGSTKLNGLSLSGSTGDMQVDLTAGAAIRLGAGNHFEEHLKDKPTITGNKTGITLIPSHRSDITSSPITTIFGTPTTSLDVTKYDDGSGTLASIDPNKFANQYIVAYLSINESQVEVQTILHFYGTAQYGTLVEAVSNAGDDIDIPSDSTNGGVILGCFSVDEGTTNLGAEITAGTAVLTQTNKLGQFLY